VIPRDFITEWRAHAPWVSDLQVEQGDRAKDARIAELFQKDVRTINPHLVNLFDEGELGREATIRKLRMVRAEGGP